MAICFKTSLLDDTLLGGKHHKVCFEEFLIVEVLHAEYSINSVVRLDVEHVLDGTSLRILVALGHFIAFLPIATSLTR